MYYCVLCVVAVAITSLSACSTAGPTPEVGRSDSAAKVVAQVSTFPKTIDTPEHVADAEQAIRDALKSLSAASDGGEQTAVARRLDEPRGRESLVDRIMDLAAWLERQEAVVGVRLPLHTAEGVSATVIQTSLPGQVRIGLDFRSEDGSVSRHELVLHVESGQPEFAQLSRLE